MKKKRELVRHFLFLSGMEVEFEELADHGWTSMLDYIPDLTEDVGRELSTKILKKLESIYIEHISNKFSTSDLEFIIRFFDSKVGKRLSKELLKLNEKSRKDLQGFLDDYLDMIITSQTKIHN